MTIDAAAFAPPTRDGQLALAPEPLAFVDSAGSPASFVRDVTIRNHGSEAAPDWRVLVKRDDVESGQGERVFVRATADHVVVEHARVDEGFAGPSWLKQVTSSSTTVRRGGRAPSSWTSGRVSAHGPRVTTTVRTPRAHAPRTP
jgi:hypothetical protein